MILLLSLWFSFFGRTEAAPQLTVEFTGISTSRGQVLVDLRDREGNSLKQVRIPAKTPSVRHTFKNLPPGTYALAAFHDENGNEELDIGLFGPKERYGFSNNARGTFGPPELSKQLFKLDQDLTLSIKLI